jgi:hypothetical protein
MRLRSSSTAYGGLQSSTAPHPHSVQHSVETSKSNQPSSIRGELGRHDTIRKPMQDAGSWYQNEAAMLVPQWVRASLGSLRSTRDVQARSQVSPATPTPNSKRTRAEAEARMSSDGALFPPAYWLRRHSIEVNASSGSKRKMYPVPRLWGLCTNLLVSRLGERASNK